MLKIGDFLIVIAIALVVLILGVALFRGDRMLTALQFALVLTVAAVPVAMPAVLSVTMAVGARKLTEKQAIVTHLAAMEELAGIDVLCSDKTGTLTQNQLTLGEPQMGVKVKMVTGDQMAMAREMARQLGIGENKWQTDCQINPRMDSFFPISEEVHTSEIGLPLTPFRQHDEPTSSSVRGLPWSRRLKMATTYSHRRERTWAGRTKRAKKPLSDSGT